MKKINWGYKFNPTQKRLFIFAFINIYFGMVIFVTSNLITTYLSNELWHKIGIIEIIFFISISTFLNLLCIMIDISVLKNGLDVIKVTKNKRTEKVEYSC